MREHHYVIALARIAHTGLSNFIRNAWLSTAATAIMIVTLTILLSTVVLNKALGDTIKDISRDITVSIYINDNADASKVESLEADLKKNPEVRNVNFISKDQAYGRYLTRYQNNPELLAGIELVGNALPASFEVELVDLSENKQLVKTASGSLYEDIIYKFDRNRLSTVEKIGDTQRFITRAGFVAAALFAVISILVIFNTIRMTIFTRSDEIKIMRLIGATNGYIRGPFLFEAMIYGLLAAVVSLIIVYTTLNTLGPKVNRHVFFDPTIQMFASYWWLVTLGTFAVGILIGVISSNLAAARYMKK